MRNFSAEMLNIFPRKIRFCDLWKLQKFLVSLGAWKNSLENIRKYLSLCFFNFESIQKLTLYMNFWSNFSTTNLVLSASSLNMFFFRICNNRTLEKQPRPLRNSTNFQIIFLNFKKWQKNIVVTVLVAPDLYCYKTYKFVDLSRNCQKLFKNIREKPKPIFFRFKYQVLI